MKHEAKEQNLSPYQTLIKHFPKTHIYFSLNNLYTAFQTQLITFNFF